MRDEWIMVTLVVAFFFFLVVLVATSPAYPHEAPTGWKYPYQCCSDKDCRPISAEQVREGPDGYTIVNTGEVIGYTDRRIKDSPDGLWHWCSRGGREDGATICLFRPPRLF